MKSDLISFLDNQTYFIEKLALQNKKYIMERKERTKLNLSSESKINLSLNSSRNILPNDGTKQWKSKISDYSPDKHQDIEARASKS